MPETIPQDIVPREVSKVALEIILGEVGTGNRVVVPRGGGGHGKLYEDVFQGVWFGELVKIQTPMYSQFA